MDDCLNLATSPLLCLLQINQARADELVYLQNESKLEQVQLQFPSDNLFLTQTLDVIDVRI